MAFTSIYKTPIIYQRWLVVTSRSLRSFFSCFMPPRILDYPSAHRLACTNSSSASTATHVCTDRLPQPAMPFGGTARICRVSLAREGFKVMAARYNPEYLLKKPPQLKNTASEILCFYINYRPFKPLLNYQHGRFWG